MFDSKGMIKRIFLLFPGETQAAIAKQLDCPWCKITSFTISNWASEKATPTIPQLYRISQVTGASLDDLIMGGDIPRRKRVISSAQAQELLALRDQIGGMIEKLAAKRQEEKAEGKDQKNVKKAK